MSSKVVAMVALPAPVVRGAQKRSDLSYRPYAQATWEWWCARHGIEFLVVDHTPLDGLIPNAPATILRWSAPAEILRTRPRGTRVAMVDADTMVRWDAPDFFEYYDARLCAVRSQKPAWIRQTLEAFRPFFPGVALKPERYFNAGMVLAGKPQLELFAKFGEFCAERFAELDRIFRSANFGTDQTVLNLIARREKHPVRLLPVAFNLTYCFGWCDPAARDEFESHPNPDWKTFEARVLAPAHAFDFINWGYVWHFTNTLVTRTRVMEETWRRIRHHYR